MRDILYQKYNVKNETADKNVIEESDMIIKEALRLLTNYERDIVLLRIIKGYSISEAAHILKKPEDKIKSLQFQALQKLKSNLHKSGYFSYKGDS